MIITSIIIKEPAGLKQEIEIPAAFSPMLKMLGTKNPMKRTVLLDILQLGIARMVAQGNRIGYCELADALDELNVWTASTVNVNLSNQ